jgi:hypothetical protein
MPSQFDFVNPNQPVLDRSAAPAPINAPAAVQPPVPTQNPAGAPQAADTEGRKGRWKNFLQRLQTDPIVQQQLLQAGITMLQGQRQNEGFNGLLGRTLQAGALSGQFLRRNQLQAGQAQQKIDLESERNETNRNLAEVQGRSAAENIASSQQTRRFAKKTQPTRERQLESEATTAEFAATNQEKVQKAELDLQASRKDLLDEQASLAKRTTPTVDKVAAIMQSIRDINPNKGDSAIAENAQTYLTRLNITNRTKLIEAYSKNAANAFLPKAEREYWNGLAKGQAEAGVKKAPAPAKKSAWETARDSVSVGDDYVGPDGKTYTRSE